MADNYRQLYDQSRERFLTFDQGPMIEHFALGHDGENLYFHILGDEAVLCRKTGELTVKGRDVGFNAACTAYDILSRAEKKPTLSHRWVSVAELGGNTAILHNDSLTVGVDALESRVGEMREKCRQWGGTEQKQGDVSFVVPLFDFFPVWVQFWLGEEELGLPSKFLCQWDANTLDFMFYETSWYARGYLLSRLREEAE